MSVQVSVAPTHEPVSLEDARTHLRITDTASDAEIQRLIKAARNHVQNLCGRKLITQTLVQRLDKWPSNNKDLLLDSPPVQSVTSVKYLDTNGDQQTWSADDYTVDIYATPARLRPVYGEMWPTIRATNNTIEITYIVGYGEDPGDVPADLVHAMLLLIGGLYEYQESISDQDLRDLPGLGSINALLSEYRIWGFDDNEDEAL